MKKYQKFLRKFGSAVIIFMLLIINLPILPSFASSETNQLYKTEKNVKYVPGELLIQFKKNELDIHAQNGHEILNQFLSEKSKTLTPVIVNRLISNGKLNETSLSSEKIEELKSTLISLDHNFASGNGSLLKVDLEDSVFEMAEELSKDPRVEMVTPNYIGEFFTTPSESDYSNGQLWGFYNDGATTISDADYSTNNPGTAGDDIDAALAWDKTTGSSSVIVAVLDTGIDYDHSDLDGNMWDGSSCVDEEGNPLGGCEHGYDYINDNDDPMDDYGHGTAMAGVIGASQGDGGIVGVSWSGKLMAVKIGDSSGPDAGAVIDGIDFARENGALIINVSFGFDFDVPNLEDAIERFVNYDGLFVTSAGNTRDDLGSTPWYPAAYDLDGGNYDNLISVAATDQSDELWDTGSTYGSNYGDEEVDLGAPGANIRSTYWVEGETDQYNVSSGTSRATAFVSGTAALIKAYRPSLTAQQIKLAIMESGDHADDLEGITVTESRLNAYQALLATEKALVVPTITSTTTGGNWNSTSTWEGGVVPTSTDVVEINGTVTLNTNAAIAGLLVNSGKTLRSYSSGTYTLTLSGDNADLANNGTIANYSSGKINLTVGGNLENNGTINGYITDIAGNLINTGTIYNSTYAEGNINNSGTISGYLVPDGAEQVLAGTGTFGNINIYSDVTAEGDIDMAQLLITSGYSLTIGETDTVYVSGNLNLNSGSSVSGGNLTLDGAAQTMTYGGDLDVDTFTLAGTGNKTLDNNLSVSGDLIINSGAALYAYGDRTTHTVTVGGDFTNNGSVSEPTGYYYGWFSFDVSGETDNTGTLTSHYVYTDGDYTNTGTHSGSLIAYDNAANSGTLSGSVYMNGTSPQTLTGDNPLTSLSIGNDVTAYGDPDIGTLTVNSGKTLTLESGHTMSVSGNLNLYSGSSVSGGNLTLDGAAQTMTYGGDLDVDTFTLAGTGNKTLDENLTVSGDLIINSGATLYVAGDRSTHTVTVGGDVTNAGYISEPTGYYYGYIWLYIYGDLANSGSMNNNRTYAKWDEAQGADSYDFQYTDTEDEWQTEVSTGTNTYYNITSFEEDDRRWRWRSVTGGTPDAWSEDKYIN